MLLSSYFWREDWALGNVSPQLQDFSRVFYFPHCVKSSKYGVFPGPYFPAFSKSPYSVRMRENMDQKNFVFEHFSRSVWDFES